jgi:hypothetical protein
VIRLFDQGKARRAAAVDSLEFPSGVRHRFALARPDLTVEDVRRVEAAARQWFRLVARNPRVKLAMPSVVVDDLWHELVLDTREYATFCQAAFGRFLHHVPDPVSGSPAELASRSRQLLATLEFARQDEGCEGPQLPLLFSIDQQLAVAGGRRYLADCGGRGECHELRGVLCLRHLAGQGRLSRLGRDRGAAHYGTGVPPSFNGSGGGCGGGGDGG